MEPLEGLECSSRRRVEKRHLAEHLLEKGVEAVSTPSLLYFAESTLRQCLEQKLEPRGLTSVGVWASIRHLTRAPSGAELEVSARILNQEGRRLTGYIRVRWGQRLVAEVFHERRIIPLKDLQS